MFLHELKIVYTVPLPWRIRLDDVLKLLILKALGTNCVEKSVIRSSCLRITSKLWRVESWPYSQTISSKFCKFANSQLGFFFRCYRWVIYCDFFFKILKLAKPMFMFQLFARMDVAIYLLRCDENASGCMGWKRQFASSSFTYLLLY